MSDILKKIEPLHIEDLRNEIHPSFFDENEDYDMFILRLPIIKKELNVLEVKSFGFVMTDQNSYLYNKSTSSLEEIGSKYDGPYKIADKIFDKYLKSFIDYQERVADMEEYMYEDKDIQNFMKNWLDIKRDVTRIERVLMRASAIMEQIINYYKEDEVFPINHYTDLHEHIDRAMRSAELNLSKLDYLYSFYAARTNDKMNKMVYLLTIISAIFLPLNLLVGFFGMNTTGLPFSDGSTGTIKAVILMISIFSIMVGVSYFVKNRLNK